MDKAYLKFVDKVVRTKWVKEWVGEFLKGLDSTNLTRRSIKAYCLKKKAEFEAECQRLSLARLSKENREDSGVGWKNSAATHMSQIRTAIKNWSESQELTPENSYEQQTKEGLVKQHLALQYMNYPSNFHSERTAPTEVKKQEQRRNLETINCVEKYLENINTLLKSDDYREITAGLIAATGRRPSEILKTGEFKQVGQYEVMFTGQAKAKGEIRDAYRTFTLVESGKVIDAFAILRRMPEIKKLRQLTLSEIDSGRNSQINSKIKEYFSPLIKPPAGESELSAKNLRAIYAAIAIYLFCSTKQSTNQFITERLGHTSDATASNYEDYQVCDADGQPLTRGAWIDRIDQEMTKPLEATITQHRIRMSEAAKIAIDDLNFLPFPDQISRIDELIRLAKIGKDFEDGKLIREVIKVVTTPLIKEKSNDVENNISESTAPENSEPINTDKSTVATKNKKVIKHKDVTELSDAELFGSNVPYSAGEKIRRAVQAIKIYNESQAEKKYWWAINTKGLKDLTGCRTEAVKNYLDSEEGKLNVEDYNNLHDLGYHHNRGKGKISDFIKIASN